MDVTLGQAFAVRGVDGELLSKKSVPDSHESEATITGLKIIVLAMGVVALLAQSGKEEKERNSDRCCCSGFHFSSAQGGC